MALLHKEAGGALQRQVWVGLQSLAWGYLIPDQGLQGTLGTPAFLHLSPRGPGHLLMPATQPTSAVRPHKTPTTFTTLTTSSSSSAHTWASGEMAGMWSGSAPADSISTVTPASAARLASWLIARTCSAVVAAVGSWREAGRVHACWVGGVG